MLLPVLVCAAALPAWAQMSDANSPERRADKRYTEQLNRRAHAAAQARDNVEYRRVEAINRARQDRYREQMAEWRRRVAACRAGDYDACE